MARRTFGATWWGKAWLDALEQRALVDPNRLARGRTYARQDKVDELELSPGLVRAQVWGTDLYSTQLSVRVLSDPEWDQVLDVVMGQAANSAALLAGEVPRPIGDLVLPDRGDLGPDCSCPDWGDPCKHAAALCYIVADLLDDDPFALLALRGRGRDAVLAQVRRRRTAALGGVEHEASLLPRGADPGTSAAAAYRRAPVTADRSAPVPTHAARRWELGTAPPADSGIVGRELHALVLDAADRAWHMLAQGASSGLDGSTGEDVVRRAARSAPAEITSIAAATGLDPTELRAAAAAWKVAGRAGYNASRRRWEPGADELDIGVRALGPTAKVRGNRVSVGPMQLRLDQSATWWRFDADDVQGWVLTNGPAIDPSDLFDPAELDRTEPG